MALIILFLFLLGCCILLSSSDMRYQIAVITTEIITVYPLLLLAITSTYYFGTTYPIDNFACWFQDSKSNNGLRKAELQSLGNELNVTMR